MKKTKILAFILAFAMLLSCAAFAAPEEDSYEQVKAQADAQMEQYGSSEHQASAEDVKASEAVNAAKTDVPQLPPKGAYVDGQLLVKVRRTTSLQDSESLFDGLADKVETVFSLPLDGQGASLSSDETTMADWFCINLAAGVDILSAWNTLLGSASVITVEPNYICTADSSIEDVSANDPYIHAQTWLEQIQAPAACDALGDTAPGNGAVVAVVDSGVDLKHPDLQSNLLSGYDFVNSDDSPDDDYGHGTHVAGIIAAENNAVGVRGVAYGAKILPVKVLGENGDGGNDNIAKGILYAAGQNVSVIKDGTETTISNTNKASVINLSLGGLYYNSIIDDAVQTARKAGCLVVAAAGNYNLPTGPVSGTYQGAYFSPANNIGVLSVMAMDSNVHDNGDWLANFSNYDSDPGSGYEYEIMAPGTDILSTTYDGKYGYMSGTSMACPVVAGAAAVLMAKGCNADTAWKLLTSCDKAQGKTVDGTALFYPMLNLSAAVEKISTTPTVAPVITNASVSAVLSVPDELKSLDLSQLNTTSRVYYLGNKFLSTVSVSFENFGGAGTVSVSGTVGGVTVSGMPTEVGLDGTGTVVLTVPEAKVSSVACINRKVEIALTLTPNNGGQAVTVNQSLTASEFVLPTSIGLTYSLTNSRYELSSSSTITMDGSTYSKYPVLLLDKNLYIGCGKTLTVEAATVYETSNIKINVDCDNTASTYGALNILSGNMLGSGKFVIGGGEKNIGWVDLWDDDIKNPQFSAILLEDCRVQGSGTCNVYSISETGFCNCSNMIITAQYFLRNLVNYCRCSTLNITGIGIDNTFAENYENSADSVLKVYAADYGQDTSGKTVGLAYSSVIGPMAVYQTGTTTPAKVFDIYYQAVNGDIYTDTPDGVTDTLTCASGSTVGTTLNDLNSYGFANDSPAFVTGINCSSYFYNSDTTGADYEIKYDFSTAVATQSDQTYEYSYTDPLAGSAQTTLEQDGKSCTATGSVIVSDYDIENYYQLGGYYTETNVSNSTDSSGKTTTTKHQFGKTYLVYQPSERYPIKLSFSSLAMDSLSVELANNQPVLTWSDSRYQDSYTAEIYRSDKGGEYKLLGSVAAGVKSYTDTSPIEAGNKYDYEVVAYSGDSFALYAYQTLVVPLADKDMGVDFTVNPFTDVNDNTVSVGLNGACLVNGCMQIEIGWTAGALDVSSISFADQVKNCGLPYAVEKGTNNIMVTIGLPESTNDQTSFSPGDLFTLKVKNGGADENVTLKTTIAGKSCSWQNNDSCSYSIVDKVGMLAQDSDHGSAQLWRTDGSGADAYYSIYSGTGKMSSVTPINTAGSYDFNSLLGSGAVLKAFFLNSGTQQPIRNNVEIRR